MKAGVFGSGSWGTALAQVLCDNGAEVLVYGRNREEVEEICNAHQNSRYFGDIRISPLIRATCETEALSEYADLFLLAVPAQAIPEAVEKIKPYIRPDTLIVNAAKGFEKGTNKRLSVCIRDALNGQAHREIVSLIGPSHAEEVIRRMLTSVCAVSADAAAAETVQKIFSNEYLRVYVTADEIGAECGVAVKNVIALASGMLEGRGYGDNAKAALITRGLSETVRYGMKKGGQRETFSGLTGVGDLIVTCFSRHSRNYRAGVAIGLADSASALADIPDKTVEGVHSARAIREDAAGLGVEMPIVSAVYRVLFEEARPSEEIARLMRRPLRHERDDR